MSPPQHLGDGPPGWREGGDTRQDATFCVTTDTREAAMPASERLAAAGGPGGHTYAGPAGWAGGCAGAARGCTGPGRTPGSPARHSAAGGPAGRRAACAGTPWGSGTGGGKGVWEGQAGGAGPGGLGLRLLHQWRLCPRRGWGGGSKCQRGLSPPTRCPRWCCGHSAPLGLPVEPRTVTKKDSGDITPTVRC